MTPERPAEPRDLTRTLLGVLCVGALIVATFWIVRPFLASAIWAMTIVVVTWPLLLRLQTRLWNSRALAITAMMVVLVLLLAVPLLLAVGTVFSNADEIADRLRLLIGYRIPPPPDWIVRLPMVGERIASTWREFEASGSTASGRASCVRGSVTGWFVAEAGSLGFLARQFLPPRPRRLMYAHGEEGGRAAVRLGRRRGPTARTCPSRRLAIRGVALRRRPDGRQSRPSSAAPASPRQASLRRPLRSCVPALNPQIGMLFVLMPAVAWYTGTAMRRSARCS